MIVMKSRYSVVMESMVQQAEEVISNCRAIKYIMNYKFWRSFSCSSFKTAKMQ